MPNDVSNGTRLIADATPPALGPNPEVLLDHIKEISQTARGSWFALLALLAFVGVTMMAHTDAAFFASGVATELPVVGLTVPTVSFFVAAPLLMAALYAHLQLYLVSLWDAIGNAPERIGPDCLIDRIHPTMIAQSAVLYRARTRKDTAAPVRAFGAAMEAITALLVWVATPALIAWMFWRSMALHSPALTLWIGACLTAACLFGFEGLRVARGRLSRRTDDRDAVHARWGWRRRLSAAALVGFFALFSWETTRGGLLPYDVRGLPPLLVSANLREAELTPRPPDWKPFELWLRDLRRERGIRDPDQDPLIPTAEEMERYRLVIAALDAPTLNGRDLREVDLSGAFLPGTDLREANLQGANLFSAQLQGARLSSADLQGAVVGDAQLQGANLLLARLDGAYLALAGLQGVTLSGATLTKADLSGARMQGAASAGAKMQEANLGGVQAQGAVLFKADMVRANLRKAVFDGADLRGTQLGGADLSWARLHGAGLGGAEMQGADLHRAEMQGADLRGSQLNGADCSNAVLAAALVGSAHVTCRPSTLTEDQLLFTVGDIDTLLPAKLQVQACLNRTSLPSDGQAEIDAWMEFHPEERSLRRLPRAQIRDAIFCGAGEVPYRVGRHLEPAASD